MPATKRITGIKVDPLELARIYDTDPVILTLQQRIATEQQRVAHKRARNNGKIDLIRSDISKLRRQRAGLQRQIDALSIRVAKLKRAAPRGSRITMRCTGYIAARKRILRKRLAAKIVRQYEADINKALTRTIRHGAPLPGKE